MRKILSAKIVNDKIVKEVAYGNGEFIATEVSNATEAELVFGKRIMELEKGLAHISRHFGSAEQCRELAQMYLDKGRPV